jgi:hypothetical protein
VLAPHNTCAASVERRRAALVVDHGLLDVYALARPGSAASVARVGAAQGIERSQPHTHRRPPQSRTDRARPLLLADSRTHEISSAPRAREHGS